MLQAIYEAVDSGEASAQIFFADFSKGFDIIDHSILMQELVLHVEIVLKTKQPEAETSLVYDVFIRVIKKRARAERVTREKETE